MPPGPPPKNPKTRQRRNKASTRATVKATRADVAIRAGRPPSLPKGWPWHDQTKAWWNDIWKSPMRDEFLEVDRHALNRLAVLVNEFWMKPSSTVFDAIGRESAKFGLTPLDRRRLDWSVEEPEAPPAPPAKGKAAKAKVGRDGKGEGEGEAATDPRQMLRIVP